MVFALKGDIIYSKNLNELYEYKDSYVISENQKSVGVYKELPEQYKNIKIYDYTGHLIIPGLVDLHLHAPQYQFIGINMDLELLDWLNTYTFPEEGKYVDIEYAKNLAPAEYTALFKNPNADLAGLLFEQALYAKEPLTKEEENDFNKAVHTVCG